jgi:hypothetical protein
VHMTHQAGGDIAVLLPQGTGAGQAVIQPRGKAGEIP